MLINVTPAEMQSTAAQFTAGQRNVDGEANQITAARNQIAGQVAEIQGTLGILQGEVSTLLETGWQSRASGAFNGAYVEWQGSMRQISSAIDELNGSLAGLIGGLQEAGSALGIMASALNAGAAGYDQTDASVASRFS